MSIPAIPMGPGGCGDVLSCHFRGRAFFMSRKAFVHTPFSTVFVVTLYWDFSCSGSSRQNHHSLNSSYKLVLHLLPAQKLTTCTKSKSSWRDIKTD